MYVAHVTSNGKGGVDCDLGPKTLVIGPNGTGKTALLNAVELALSGRASYIYGREEVGKESDLIAHLAPDRKGLLYSKALIRLDDGNLVPISWQAGGKGSKKANHVVPAMVDVNSVFPLRAVLDAVRGNAETARKFFLQFAVGEIKDGDVLARIPDSLHGHYRRAVLKAVVSDAPVDKLLLALEHAKKEMRSAREKAKASRAASSDAAQGLAPLPTDETVKATQGQHKQAKEKLDTLKAAQAAAGALERTRIQFTAMKAQLEASQTEMDRAAAALHTADQALAAMTKPIIVGEEFQNLLKVIDWHLTDANDYCRVCGRDADPALFEARKAAARDFVEKVKTDSAAYLHAQGVRDAAKLTLSTIADQHATLITQAQAMSHALNSASTGGGPDPQAIEAAEAEVKKLDEQLKGYDVLKAAWSSSKRATENGLESDEEAGRWEKLVDACTDAIAKLLDTGVVGFQQRVQNALPATDHFQMVLRDGQKAIFQFGLEKSGVLYTATSGAEWARVLGALAAACAPPEDKLSVIIPPPGEFRAETLAPVMRAFGALRSQVVIAAPYGPGEDVEGWTIIDTGKGQHQAGGEAGGEAGRVVVQVPAAPTIKAVPAPEPEPEPLPAPSEEPLPPAPVEQAVVAEPGVAVSKPLTW